MNIEAYTDIRSHVSSIIKNRGFTITGDESHLTVRYIMAQAKNIDAPRKYDFQPENVNEQDFLRSIDDLIPITAFRISDNFSRESVTSAISGDASLTIDGMYDMKCYDCAKRLRLTVSGNNLHIDCKESCENNQDFYVDIDFPTGEVVYADWPDRFSEIKDVGYLDECENGGESINYLKGQRQRSEGFAAQGIFHLSVGNTCPPWFYNKKTDEIRIGGGQYDEDKDDVVTPKGFKKMGWFCTDLWWVTMLDRSRYDEMLSKLPKERSDKYYDKGVETAKIKPGRYRFYSVPSDSMGDDGDSTRLYARAEYLGPCGEVPKVKCITEGKVILAPHQMVALSGMRYPTLYNGNYERMRFRVMDQIFNVLGNGIRSKGEFLSHISVPPGTVITEQRAAEEGEVEDYAEPGALVPYPNFRKEYSLIGSTALCDIPTDWLREMVWFYTECKKFFLSDDVRHYHGAYPSDDNSIAMWIKTLEKRRQEGQTEEDFNAAMLKDYGIEFNGDLHDFLSRKWQKELKRIMDFIDETIEAVNKELTLC